jgi:hypothetical protein
MENLVIRGIEEEEFSPDVTFNAYSGQCEISGESVIAATKEFYTPLINWILRYIEEEKGPITFNIKLTHYDTSSAKMLFEMLQTLKTYMEKGGDVTINWYCPKDDPEYMNEVKDVIEALYLRINLKSQKNNKKRPGRRFL